jgi:murein L,D-transpeptidase YcbB/YkuD
MASARAIPALALALCLGAAPGWAVAEYGSAADLERVLERLRSPEVEDGWVRVGEGATLRRGAYGSRVERLQRRLRAGGDLAGEATGGRFDAATEEALRRFQVRHGLADDGIAGRDTIAALDASLDDRIREIEANLTARRAFESRAEPRFVLVNVPDYRLTLVESGASTLTMKVAVGEEGWETPPIDEEIRKIVVNPVWNLPATIVAADLAPKVLANPRHLEQKGFVVLSSDGADPKPIDPKRIDWKSIDPEAFSYLVRQQPGPENLLGRLKFVFPNREDIYLHDTPHREVFGQVERDVSHGCIRLEKAYELAVELLRETPGWSRQQLDQHLVSGETEDVPLAKPVPVHLVYWTAWVALDGTLQHRDDIYGEEIDPDTTPL